MRTLTRLSALGLGLSVFAAPVAAQDVVAGLTLTVSLPSKPDTIVFRRTVSRGGVDTADGTRTVIVQTRKAADGSALLHVVQRFPAQFGEIVDTAIADGRTLRAVSHQSHQPLRSMRFTFKGANVEGQLLWQSTATSGAKGSSGAASEAQEEPQTQNVKVDVGGPIFDSNIIEFVAAALPLAANYKTELPFFIYERNGRVMMPVAVKSRESVTFPTAGTRDAWIVTVGVPDVPATVWVDAETRAVLRVRYEAPKSTYTDERFTPLRK